MTMKINPTIATTHVARYAEDRVPSRSQWPPAWLAESSATPARAVPVTDAEPPVADIAEQSSIDSAHELATMPVVSERQPYGLLSPRPRAQRIHGQCKRCGATRYYDVPIHGGQSTRRDCARCDRFIEFPIWHGKILDRTASI